MGDLVIGLGGGGVEHDVVGGLRLRQRGRDPAGDLPTGERQTGKAHCTLCSSAERAFQRLDHVIGGDDAGARAT